MRPPHRLTAREIDQPVKDEIEATIKARGWCIGGYAQVEYILADFVFKVSKLPAYAEFRDPPPHRFESRLKRVRAIADAAGPLSKYREGLVLLTSAIERWEELRHFLTHGWLDVTLKKPEGVLILKLRRFRPEKGNPWAVQAIAFSRTELETTGSDISDLAEQALLMFDDIYAEFDLETG